MLKLSDEDKLNLLLLVCLTLAIRIAFTGAWPLIKDENLYARMTDELLMKPTLIPAFLGFEVAWRPAAYFYAYAPFVAFLSALNIQAELIYRLPSVFFFALCTAIFYQFTLEYCKKRNTALAAALVFTLNPLSVYVSNTALTDTLLLLFILSALFCYQRALSSRRFFLPAATFLALAFFTKTVVAFIIVPLALCMFFLKKKPAEPLLWASFLAIPLSIAAYYLMFESKEAFYNEFFKNATSKLPSGTGFAETLAERFWSSFLPFAALCLVWLGFFAIGLAKNFKKHAFFLLWLAFIIFSISGGGGMPWYYLPIIPAISFFAALAICPKDEFDNLTIVLFITLLLFTLGGLVYFYSLGMPEISERQAGLFAAGKQNVLVFGRYPPAVFFYKAHTEKMGGTSSFCWINSLNASDVNDTASVLGAFHNYSTFRENDSFSEMTDLFWRKQIYKMPCSISRFDWLITAGIDENVTLATGEFELANRTSGDVFVFRYIGK
jgi:4-amino-4-deoxy-L-arabinose transferase-like glycosyltransferase